MHHNRPSPRTFRKPESKSLIVGRQPLIEAIANGTTIDKILLQINVQGDNIGMIRRLAAENNIPIQVVPPEKLNGITRTNHQGVLAFMARVRYMDLQTVINFVVSNGEVPLFVMLDGITDVRNIGGMARSAVCCGVQAMIIPDKGVGALNEDAMKSSAGALDQIQICRVNSLLKAVDTMHENGIQIFTTATRNENKLESMDFKMPACIIMGSEDKGVVAHLAKASDYFFSIPMKGNFDSLNVSASASIIFYEAMKQRM